ncbi:MAG TPA: thioredoxin family protein [Acidobacteriaceae bacterium]|nr:thioredoxin family protein [Acidobacteriaceae bacterium]
MPISSPPPNSRIFRRFLGVMTAFCAFAVVPSAGVAAQARPETPVMVPRHIYSEAANPQADINAALAQARRDHKRVLLDFGGDWCGDCQVLEIYFREPVNAALLGRHYVLVHVWIGQMDHNIQLAARYGVPIAKGVPALAVLSADGKAIYSQQTGQFNDMRHMDSSSVTAFLNKWKG